MDEIIEYIMANYTLLLAGAIIILLAIIGSYADKTNFGQGKQKETKEKTKDELIKDLDGKTLNEALGQPVNENVSEEVSPVQNSLENNAPLENPSIEQPQEVEPQIPVDPIDIEYNNLDQQFNEVLPKESVIDNNILDEIDNLSLDKTQQLNVVDIPDVDDVELPEIKDLRQEDEDIWKF